MIQKSKNVRGWDNVLHMVDNLCDRGAQNVDFNFDTNKECYVITWKENNGDQKS